MRKEEFDIVYKWLADAPLFIDAEQVDRFHDAVVMPLDRIISSTHQFGGQKDRKAIAEAAAKATAGLPFLSFLKGEVKGKLAGELASSAFKNTSVVFQTIETPQRQLVQLAWHYDAKLKHRAAYVTNPANAEWRSPDVIGQVPRLLVFLDLPGHLQAEEQKMAPVKFIPMAAEFANGKIVPLYSQVKSAKAESPPAYDEIPEGESHRENRRKYWAWFDKHFSATRAMELIETVAGKNGRIQWIDFRVPVSQMGDTLHVHVAPHGHYDTGSIAYRLVKRGFRHGIRVVGTMNSGPDMHVLAIYDK